MRLTPSRLFGALALALGLGGSAAAVPMAIPYTGYVTVDGTPGSTPIASLVVKVYDALSGGTLLWTGAEMTNVPVSNGRFSIGIAGAGLDSALVNNENLWIEFTLDGEALAPRQKLLSVGTAITVGNAETLDGNLPSDFLLAGGDASVGSLTTAGDVEVGGAVQVGPSTDACVPAGAGTLRWWSGKLSLCDGTAWRDIITPAAAEVDWSMVLGVPSGFADGTDDIGPQYFAGTGMYTSGSTFHLAETWVQRRITTTCPGGAMAKVNQSGVATCVTVGKTYSASASGGVVITGTSMSLMSCSANQILKYTGGSWSCANDSNIATFGDVSGTATDAQIPNTVTVNYAQDSDKVDGHHYDPLWDSTDASTLGGMAPDHFATAQDLSDLNTKLSTLQGSPPSMLNALCANALPTRVCERDVYDATTHTRDQNSFMMRSGGQWTYYALGQRCEYQGGTEAPAMRECGFSSAPSWMDTSDECGGFHQSTWDSRVWFAVSKSAQWDPYENYTCPAGYRPMTTAEGEDIFRGPQNNGQVIYYNQCGWNGYLWGGKHRQYFRFIDSAERNWSFKDSNSYDVQSVQFGTSSIHNFAGIICISETPPGPLDWMATNDTCGGFRVSTFNPNFAFAVSKKNTYEPNLNYQCPSGWHWATTAEAYAVFNNTSPSSNGARVYQNQCGWTSYQMDNSGIERHIFRFADSFKGASTLAAMHAGYADEYSVQFDIGKEPISHNVNPSYFAGIVCAKDNPPPANPLDWMDTTDYCGGWRQSTWDPRFYYAVSKSYNWNPAATYACPAGYKWATWQEYKDANPITSTSGMNDQRVYSSQCGWNGSNWNNSSKTFFRFSDSGVAGPGLNSYIDAGHPEGYVGTTSSTTTNFAGIVCMKLGENYPNPGTLDWMQTDDDCKGFRPLHWDPRIRLAVARQNIWKPTYAYSCPAGYHWANSFEVDALLTGSENPGSNFYRYASQCGWNSSGEWQGRLRLYFRFADSASPGNNRFWNSTSGETGGWSTTSTTTQFAGIVCIQDDLTESEFHWWDRSDNCGGWHMSDSDPRFFYMTSRTTRWDPNKVYTCPDGYHWVTTAEWDATRYIVHDGNFNSSSYAQLYRSYGRCGWNNDAWRGYTKWKWRFQDSHVTGRYANGNSYDSFRNTDTDAGLYAFAGIVCMADQWDPTFWMDRTDNCQGWRQSEQHPDIYYAVSRSDMWNAGYQYACPTGYFWPTYQQYDTLVNQKPKPSNMSYIYQRRCGWNDYNWNPVWQMGCNSYTQLGCGSGWTYPMPSMWEYRLDQMKSVANRDFKSGCTQCEKYDSNTTCSASGTSSGPDGKCGGINEGNWTQAKNINDCFQSPNSFSGNPKNAVYNADSPHVYNGIACGDGEWQHRNPQRYYFRFANSQMVGSQGWYVHAGWKDGNNASISGTAGATSSWNTGTVANYFAGIVCVRQGALP